MTEELTVSQKAEFGAKDNTFIAEQHNHTGLTPADATQIAITMFKEYFPQLRQEALEEVYKIVENTLSQIPVNDILRPSPKIAVPLLQNASITEDLILRKMYAKLLAGDMNRQLKSSVHPAYIEIVNQLSSDDAKLFRRIVEINNSIPVARITFNFDTKYLSSVFPHYYSPYFSGMDPWTVSIGIENLSRLNIIHLFEGTVNVYNYDTMIQDPFVVERFEFAKRENPTKELSIKITEYVIQMNDFGDKLAKLCL